jgi:hypothetical protein
VAKSTATDTTLAGTDIPARSPADDPGDTGRLRIGLSQPLI